MELRIQHTWDGVLLEESEHAVLRLTWSPEALEIAVDAPFAGDPAPPGDGGATWQLWDYEVVELFLVGREERYTEIELGPHGHHLVLRLEGCRNVVEREIPIRFAATRQEERWRGVAVISREHLPEELQQINAYAIRGTESNRRFMAWSPVPGDAPDFHRIGLFPTVQEGQR